MLILSSTDDQLTDPVAVNQRILIHLFMKCQSCDQLLDVHRILEDLINPLDHLHIYKFQRGMYIAYIDSFVNVSGAYVSEHLQEGEERNVKHDYRHDNEANNILSKLSIIYQKFIVRIIICESHKFVLRRNTCFYFVIFEYYIHNKRYM